MSRVTREQVSRLVGKMIYAQRKDGSVVSGKLVRLSGNQLILEAPSSKNKAQTKLFIPLVLFDLLAIGTTPFGFGGGFYGGYGGYGYDGWW